MNKGKRTWRLRALGALAVAPLLLAIGLSPPAVAGTARPTHSTKTVELDLKSEFSHIRVKRQGSVRSLMFVRDSGEEVEESLVNLKKPYVLLAPHTHFMFSSYLFRPKQERVLIVGLGGGAMIHFLQHYDPELRVDVVEIDPAVVKIADQYFGVRSGGKLRVITTDGREYLEKTETRYDVIYMDAFLKPAPDTDAAGVPLAMKTERFYKSVQDKLQPDGLMVFNLNLHRDTEGDTNTIRSAFRQVYVFRPPGENRIVVASGAEQRETSAALHARAKEADQRFKAGFSFQELLSRLTK